jgi:hypothetical protein
MPAPVLWRIGVLPIECVWELHAAPPIRHILLVESLDLLEMILKRDLGRFGQHRDAVFVAFAGTNTRTQIEGHGHMSHPARVSTEVKSTPNTRLTAMTAHC